MSNLFGSALREARKGADKTLNRLAEEMNFSTTYLSDVERGLRPPLAPEKIALAAKLCRVRVDTLLAPAARDRGSLVVPVEGMSEEVLAAFIRMRGLALSKSVTLKQLRAAINR